MASKIWLWISLRSLTKVRHFEIRFLRGVALWKDADPDILILQQAKAEYAKLQ